MFLSQLVVVFVGIAGNHHDAVEQQLGPALENAGITELVLADGDLDQLLRHTRASRDVVRKLHVDGVIAGALVAGKRSRSFRVVMYDGDGNLSSDTATPLAGRALTKVELDVFAVNLKDAVDTIEHKHKPEPKRTPAHVARPRAARDDDAPPGFVAPAASARSAPVATVDHDDSAPVDSIVVETSAPAQQSGGGGIHVHAALTLGIVSRSLSADPNTIKPYSSVPVGTGGFDAGIDLGARTTVTGAYEHTLVMHSIVTGDSITSSIGRWQVAATYDLLHGAVGVAPVVGIGGRSFGIESTAAARTPDVDYTYLVLGASVTKPIGRRIALRGTAAYEPVIGGVQPLMTDASRSGFDVGVALDVRPTAHIFLRAAFDYQQFTSSWAMVGAATDGYPTAAVAGGASF